MRLLFTRLFVTVLALSAAAALAQSTPEINNATREIERIQREEQQRQQQQFESSRQSARPPVHIEVPEPQKGAKSEGGVCKQIDQIVLTGADHLSVMEREEIVRPYQGRCLGIGDIESLLGDITRVYIQHGFIASRAYVAQQDLSQKRLEVTVIEGTVKELQLERKKGEDNAPLPRLYLDNLFPGVVGKPLNLREIEQGLDQINRLVSNNATMEVRPGEAPGESIVVIYNTTTKPWHVNLNLDNQGSRATGREQAALTLSWDNPLGVNDFVSATRRQTVLDADGKGASSENYSYVLPYGRHTISLGVSDSRYKSTLHTAGGVDLESTGNSHYRFLREDYAAWRSQVSRLTLSTALTSKQSRNFLAGQLLDVSSRTLAVLDVGSNLNTGLFGGVVSVELGYSRGLNALGAMVDANDLPDNAPRAQFEKFTYGVSYSHPFELAGLNGAISSQLTGQRALDALYGTEQIGIGGLYSVRGFYENSLAGDHGFYWRNDVSFAKPVGNLFGHPAATILYWALDAGKVSSIAAGVPSGTLVGTAVGFSLSLGPFRLDASVGRPLQQPAALPRKEGTNGFFRISYSL